MKTLWAAVSLVNTSEPKRTNLFLVSLNFNSFQSYWVSWALLLLIFLLYTKLGSLFFFELFWAQKIFLFPFRLIFALKKDWDQMSTSEPWALLIVLSEPFCTLILLHFSLIVSTFEALIYFYLWAQKILRAYFCFAKRLSTNDSRVLFRFIFLLYTVF